MANYDSTPSGITGWLALAVSAGLLAGCAASPSKGPRAGIDKGEIRTCVDPCEVVIGLQDDITVPPDEDSRYIRVKAGQEVTIAIRTGPGMPPGRKAVVLSFNKPAFKDSQGRLHTIVLTPGQARKVTALQPADCPEPSAAEPGCEYYIINHGTETRPRKHPWIIIDPY